MAESSYDVGDQRLVVNAEEAETVQQIYETYLALGSILISSLTFSGNLIPSS